jgi:hypothetical protein
VHTAARGLARTPVPVFTGSDGTAVAAFLVTERQSRVKYDRLICVCSLHFSDALMELLIKTKQR